MHITALVMSMKPYTREWPGLNVQVLEGRIFKSARDHTMAWKEAVRMVTTPYFFFLDDDDDLPEDYMGVLAECVATGANLAYTRELMRSVNKVDPDYAGDHEPYSYQTHLREEYSQEAHLRNATLVHHLALCKTDPAKAATFQFPTDHFWPEMPFYWCMAKRMKPAFVKRIGYHWNTSETGLHTLPRTSLAMIRAAQWCAGNP